MGNREKNVRDISIRKYENLMRMIQASDLTGAAKKLGSMDDCGYCIEYCKNRDCTHCPVCDLPTFYFNGEPSPSTLSRCAQLRVYDNLRQSLHRWEKETSEGYVMDMIIFIRDILYPHSVNKYLYEESTSPYSFKKGTLVKMKKGEFGIMPKEYENVGYPIFGIVTSNPRRVWPEGTYVDVTWNTGKYCVIDCSLLELSSLKVNRMARGCEYLVEENEELRKRINDLEENLNKERTMGSKKYKGESLKNKTSLMNSLIADAATKEIYEALLLLERNINKLGKGWDAHEGKIVGLENKEKTNEKG